MESIKLKKRDLKNHQANSSRMRRCENRLREQEFRFNVKVEANCMLQANAADATYRTFFLSVTDSKSCSRIRARR